MIDFELQNEPYNITRIETYIDTVDWIRTRGTSIAGYDYNNPNIYLGINAFSDPSHFVDCDGSSCKVSSTDAGQDTFVEFIDSSYPGTIDKYAYVIHQYFDNDGAGTDTSVVVQEDTLDSGIENYFNSCPMNIIVTEVGCGGTTSSWSNIWSAYYNKLNDYIAESRDSGETIFLGSTIWVSDQAAANNNVEADPSETNGQELNNISEDQIENVYTQFPTF